jgi:hypothetical protein
MGAQARPSRAMGCGNGAKATRKRLPGGPRIPILLQAADDRSAGFAVRDADGSGGRPGRYAT